MIRGSGAGAHGAGAGRGSGRSPGCLHCPGQVQAAAGGDPGGHEAGPAGQDGAGAEERPHQCWYSPTSCC